MAEFINPLDLKKIFLEYFLGTTELFVVALTLLLSVMAAKFQMSNRIFTTILILSAIIFGGFLGNAIYALTILIVGFTTFKSLSRLWTS